MTLKEITTEIILRADEDLQIAYYHRRAESHFKSSLSMILSSQETGFIPTDYHSLIRTIKLELGENCFKPNDMREIVRLPILRIIGAYHYSESQTHCRGVKVVLDDTSFNDIINNPMTKTDVYSYIYYTGVKLFVYPFYEDCFMTYIRSFTDNDHIFSGDFDHHFSIPLRNACIETAVIGFKREITLPEFVR